MLVFRGAFSHFNSTLWSNLVVAGGAVLGALLTGNGGPEDLDTKFPNSDVDVFFYGLDEQGAKDKLVSVFEKIKTHPNCKSQEGQMLACRTPFTVTFLLKRPMRHVQFILRLHATKQDVVEVKNKTSSK